MKALDSVFDIEDDILLIFFLLLSPLTQVGLENGESVAEAVPLSAHNVWTKRVKEGKTERDKQAAFYMKSDATPVWVHSSKLV